MDAEIRRWGKPTSLYERHFSPTCSSPGVNSEAHPVFPLVASVFFP